jgi:hypothetical protein
VSACKTLIDNKSKNAYLTMFGTYDGRVNFIKYWIIKLTKIII